MSLASSLHSVPALKIVLRLRSRRALAMQERFRVATHRQSGEKLRERTKAKRRTLVSLRQDINTAADQSQITTSRLPLLPLPQAWLGILRHLLTSNGSTIC